jgi:hypothetical protein
VLVGVERQENVLGFDVRVNDSTTRVQRVQTLCVCVRACVRACVRVVSCRVYTYQEGLPCDAPNSVDRDALVLVPLDEVKQVLP